MTGPIVVGVDSSETALSAARRAARLAEALDVPLHIVTAFEDAPVEVVGIGSDTFAVSTDSAARAVAEGVARKVRWDDAAITTTAVEGKPADVLVSEAERVDASLVVVGNRRMQGVARVLGSIANSVSHHAPCDVYIVKTT
jgi:nucleotide-binding universal stress UspA family protein